MAAEAKPGQLGIGQGLKIILISQAAAEIVGADAAALLGQSLAVYDPTPGSPLCRRVELMLANPEASSEPVLLTVSLGERHYRATLSLEESEGEPMVRVRFQAASPQAENVPYAPAVSSSLSASAVSRFALADSRQELQALLSQAMRSAAPELSGAVLRLDHETGFLVPFLQWGHKSDALQSGIPAGDCWALRAGESHLCESGDDLPCLKGVSLNLPSAAVPLVARAELLGVLIAWSDTGLSLSLGLAEELGEALKPHLSRVS